MATNVYDREEIVKYDPANPCHYFGWHVSTTSDDFSITGFHFEEVREQFVAEVAKALKKHGVKTARAQYVAPLAYGVFEGGTDAHAGELLDRELSDDFEDGEEGGFYYEHLEAICKKYNDIDDEKRLAQVKAK